MTVIFLQAGHQNIQTNCYPDMRGGTGASGEITWTPLLRARVGSHLQRKGFDVHQADANLNCQPIPPKAPDLTLALHYQADNPQHTVSGFGVFVPDPSVDLAHTTSVIRANTLRKIYAKRSGLPDYSDPDLKGPGPTWSNPNTRFYYLWNTQTGPLALIECGVGAPGALNHTFLWSHIDIVAAAIAEGICAMFGVAWTPPLPVPVPIPPIPPAPPEAMAFYSFHPSPPDDLHPADGVMPLSSVRGIVSAYLAEHPGHLVEVLDVNDKLVYQAEA